MKILVVSSRFPYPLLKGDKLRLYHQLRYLSNYHEICLISISTGMPTANHLNHIRSFIPDVRIIQISKWRRVLNVVFHIFKRMPLQVAYFHTSRSLTKVKSIIKEVQPNHIYAQLIRTVPYLKDQKGIPMTIDYMDAFSLGAKRRASKARNIWSTYFWNLEARKLKRYEEEIYKLFDRHTIISERDRAHLSAKNISIISNGIEVPEPVNLIGKYEIGFIGNLGYYPNQMAIDYLIEQVYPVLNKRIPDIKVLICGTHPSPKILSYASNNIQVKGYVENIISAYRNVSILVAPIFQGSGLQNKILEAMAARVVCITTSNVNASINAIPNEQILIADTVAEYCNAIDLLLRDQELRKQIVDKAYLFVKQNYDWNISNHKLNAILSSRNQNLENVI